MSAQRLPTWGLKQHAQEALPQVATLSISSCEKQNRILWLLGELVLFLSHKKVVPGHYSNINLGKSTRHVVPLNCCWNVSSGDTHQQRMKFKLLNWCSVTSRTLLWACLFLKSYKKPLLCSSDSTHQGLDFLISVFVCPPKMLPWLTLPTLSSFAVPKLNILYLKLHTL